jgi:hypothetical protein
VLGGATEARAGDLEKAKALYQEAQEAFAAGRYAEAADLFYRAFAESHRPAFLWNAASSHRRQFEIDRDPSRLRKAREVYLNYSDLTESSSEKQDARKAIAEIDQQLASAAPTTTTTTRTTAAPRRGAMVAGGVVLGIGVALGAAALGTGLSAGHDYDSLVASCGGNLDRCPDGFQSTRDAGRELEIATWVLASVGAVAAITGAALLVVGVRNRATKESVSVRPLLLAGGGALIVRGSF